MDYIVGTHVDLTYLNSPQQNERREALAHVKKLSGKFLPGAKVRFMKMATGLIVMDVAEPETMLTVSFG